MQFSNARLLGSDGSGHLNESEPQQFGIIAHPTIGNPGSLCVTGDITRVNYREHMTRSLELKIC